VTATTLVAGRGYVGGRFAARQPPDAIIAVSRSLGLDLDTAIVLPVEVPAAYTVLYTVPPAPKQPGDLRLERLLALLQPVPSRIVYIGTTGVYGDCDGAIVDENRPVHPESDRARLRVAAELYLQEWCVRRDVPWVILRVPGIYGPGRLGVERIRAGAAAIRDSEANPGNRIHVDDLLRCCEAGLRHSTPAGIYNVGDGDYRSATAFAAEVARQCGLPAPPGIGRAEAEREFSPMRWSFLRESRRIDTRKMREVLGVTPRYADPAEGIAASLAEDPAQGVHPG
jgi:nucleoside-diphosphate-sugar epimerase